MTSSRSCGSSRSRRPLRCYANAMSSGSGGRMRWLAGIVALVFAAALAGHAEATGQRVRSRSPETESAHFATRTGRAPAGDSPPAKGCEASLASDYGAGAGVLLPPGRTPTAMTSLTSRSASRSRSLREVPLAPARWFAWLLR